MGTGRKCLKLMSRQTSCKWWRGRGEINFKTGITRNTQRTSSHIVFTLSAVLQISRRSGSVGMYSVCSYRPTVSTLTADRLWCKEYFPTQTFTKISPVQHETWNVDCQTWLTSQSLFVKFAQTPTATPDGPILLQHTIATAHHCCSTPLLQHTIVTAHHTCEASS
jgi:hypothetical protein